MTEKEASTSRKGSFYLYKKKLLKRKFLEKDKGVELTTTVSISVQLKLHAQSYYQSLNRVVLKEIR